MRFARWIEIIGVPLVATVMGGIGYVAKKKYDRYEKQRDAATERLAAEETRKTDALLLLEQTKQRDLEAAQIQRDQIASDVKSLLGTVETMSREVKRIAYEVQDNSGGSLKDFVRRTAAVVTVGMAVRREAVNVATWEGIVLADGSVEPAEVSDAWVRLTGMSIEQTVGNGWLRAVAPADRHRALAAAREAHANGTEMDIEYELVNTVSNATCRVRHHAKPVCDEHDRHVGWYATLTVINPPLHVHRRATDIPSTPPQPLPPDASAEVA